MTRRRWGLLIVAAVAVLLLLGRVVAGMYVDYRWYQALGAGDVWAARLQNLAILRLGFGLLGTLFVFGNLYAVRRSVYSLVLPRRLGNIDISEEVPGRYLAAAVITLSVLVGGLLALPQDDWTSLGMVRWGQPFGETDPHFESDFGFWIYWLPFESALHRWCLIALIVVTTIIVFLYALTPSLRWERGTLHVSGYVRRHLTALGTLLLFLLAWSYRLDAFALLNEGTGPGGVFTSLDHRPGIPANLLLAFATATLGALVLWAGWVGQMRIAFGAVTIVLALSLGLRQLLPPLARRTGPTVDPAARESSYVRTRALHTRRAYDLDRVSRDDPAIAWRSARDAARAVSVWDAAAVSRTVERRRAGRLNGGVAWNADSARLIAVAVQQPAGPESADPFSPWPLSRLLAWAADSRGAAMNVDGSSGDDGGTIEAALVSDSATAYLVVPERQADVAAPEILRFRDRLAHAWDQQNLRLLFSEADVHEPRMLLHRAVRERVERLAPFFKQGLQVLPLLHRDSLYWVMHLYSASERYPLSERMRVAGGVVSYIHHAATALVQAHSGDVVLVADSVPDPIARSWVARFPGLFTPAGELPPELVSALPPPVDLAVAQSAAIARAGLRGDLTPPAHLIQTAGGDTLLAAPRWPFFLLPDGRTTAWAMPVLDASDRVRGLVVSAGGAQWTTYWHTMPEPAPRWPSVLDRLQRPPDSGAVTREAPLKRGPVRLIPTRDGAAFFQTTYAWRADGPPTIARVTVIERDSLSSGATLAEALGVREPAGEAPREPSTPAEFRERVEQLYGAMREALRRGDWTAFGEAYEALGRVLRATPRQP